MKKYALIKDNSIRQTITAEQPPTIAANKGTWYEVIEAEKPEITSTQVLESSSELSGGKWVVSYSIREMTEYEKWKHKDYPIKVRIHATDIPEFSSLATMLLAQNCPMVQDTSGYIDCYLKFILQDHESIINSTEKISLFNIPENE